MAAASRVGGGGGVGVAAGFGVRDGTGTVG